MCTQNEAVIIMREVYNACKAIFGEVKEAYLYGSYARGDYHDESDVDILLTVDMTQDEISDYTMDIAHVSSELSLKHDITVSIAVKPYAQFERFKMMLPYYRNVINEGIRYAG